MIFPSQTEEQRKRSEELRKLADKAKARYDAMTEWEKREHDRRQRESFIRAMGPCEHGEYDWETCPQCLQGISNDKR